MGKWTGKLESSKLRVVDPPFLWRTQGEKFKGAKLKGNRKIYTVERLGGLNAVKSADSIVLDSIFNFINYIHS